MGAMIRDPSEQSAHCEKIGESAEKNTKPPNFFAGDDAAPGGVRKNIDRFERKGNGKKMDAFPGASILLS
jgi:hypothetical protein